MSNIVIGKSSGRNISIDLRTFLKTRALIQAGSGAGKSYLIRRLAEQLFGKVQVLIIDREGEFASLREKYGFVLAGDEGDTPTDIRSARLLAEKLLELRASAICDLYESFRTKPMNRRAWVRGFIEGLMDAPKKYWRDLVVIVDESHLFCPQESPKAANMVDREIISGCKDAMVALATAGRKRGFCAVFATQRLAKLDKDASAELMNRFVGQTIEDVDVERAAELMSVARADKAAFKKEIKDLTPGNFFGFGHAVSKDRIIIRIGRVQTTHPESGSSKYAAAPPPAPGKILHLLPKLRDLPQEAHAKAKTEGELRREIRSLKAELTKKPGRPEPAKPNVKIKEVRVEVPILKGKDLTTLKKAVAGMEKATRDLASHAQMVGDAATEVSSQIARAVGKRETTLAKPPQKLPAPRARPVTPARLPAARSKPSALDNGGPALLAGERRILEVLAQFHPGTRSRSQLGALTGLTPSGGTFGNYYGRLKRGQYLEQDAGGGIRITETGLEYFGGEIPQGPQGAAEVLEMWRTKLLAGERKMLDALVEAYPNGMTKEELGETSGYTSSGGTFGNYLGTLRRNALAVVTRESVTASDTLFEF